MATNLEIRGLMLRLRALTGMMRDTLNGEEEAILPQELLPWLGGELERLAGEAYSLGDADAATGRPEDSTALWCHTPFCCLKPGHKEPCQ